MKHFAQFALSYNNIGLGVGAAVGLARGSGLVGESQEERDNTTGFGRLGKIAGYTVGGAALGAGAGMAVKYVRGRGSNTIETSAPQTTSKPPVTRQEEAAKKLEEKLTTMDESMANSRPEPVTPAPLSRPTGYQGLGEEARAEKLTDRRETWYNLQHKNYPKTWYDKDTNKFPEHNLTIQKEINYNNLNNLQDNIKAGRYSRTITNLRNF